MITVFYHKACLDGSAAALAAWLKWKDQAQYVPVHPDTDLMQPTDVYKGHHVYMLDTCLNTNAIECLESVVNTLTVLDHHETLSNKWKNHICSCKGGFHFNLNASGATMAWAHFHPEKELPWFYRYIEASDRWEWDKEENARAFTTYLQASSSDWTSWEKWLYLQEDDPLVVQACEIGTALLKAMHQECDALMEHAMPVQLGDKHGWMLNYAGPLRSELGHRLSKKNNTFGLVWRIGLDEQKNTRVFISLRSEKPYSVRELAETYGGAGHPQASGISMPFEVWMNIMATSIPE